VKSRTPNVLILRMGTLTMRSQSSGAARPGAEGDAALLREGTQDRKESLPAPCPAFWSTEPASG
jgi:hypothetical protein